MANRFVLCLRSFLATPANMNFAYTPRLCVGRYSSPKDGIEVKYSDCRFGVLALGGSDVSPPCPSEKVCRLRVEGSTWTIL